MSIIFFQFALFLCNKRLTMEPESKNINIPVTNVMPIVFQMAYIDSDVQEAYQQLLLLACL